MLLMMYSGLELSENGIIDIYYIDLINRMPVAELISEKEDSATTKNFIKNSIKATESIAIVTDLKPGYDKIMREIGFDHQHCTFHLLLNINEELREELKQIRKEYESNLKKNKTLNSQKHKSKNNPKT